MEINGKVWCLFEQSGTFKTQFKNLGYESVDVDIQNNFGETDYQIDLFAEIENAYDGKASLFDHIKQEDLVMAFFPCIYFCENNQMYFCIQLMRGWKLNLYLINLTKDSTLYDIKVLDYDPLASDPTLNRKDVYDSIVFRYNDNDIKKDNFESVKLLVTDGLEYEKEYEYY